MHTLLSHTVLYVHLVFYWCRFLYELNTMKQKLSKVKSVSKNEGYM